MVFGRIILTQRRLARGGKELLSGIERDERQRTGISSLKVRYNKVFGYYIEISRANLHLAPEDYIRKQTLVNAEGFITADLKDYEARVLTAEEARIKRETELFQDLRRRLGGESPRLKKVAWALARLDVFAAQAEVAAHRNYCRPRVVAAPVLSIVAGRHPVIERILPPGRFVPTDVHLDESSQDRIVTGPNISGKGSGCD